MKYKNTYKYISLRRDSLYVMQLPNERLEMLQFGSDSFIISSALWKIQYCTIL